METEKLKLIIVDDNKSFREAVKLFLTKEMNCEVIGEASSGIEFLKLIKNSLPDIVLMDIQMPELDGIKATKEWCLKNPHTRIIAVTMFTEKAYLLQLIQSGFKGCVFKTSFFVEIKKAIEVVMKGKYYFENDFPLS